MIRQTIHILTHAEIATKLLYTIIHTNCKYNTIKLCYQHLIFIFNVGRHNKLSINLPDKDKV